MLNKSERSSEGHLALVASLGRFPGIPSQSFRTWKREDVCGRNSGGAIPRPLPVFFAKLAERYSPQGVALLPFASACPVQSGAGDETTSERGPKGTRVQ